MVGRIYDPRLSINGVNFVFIINTLPILFAFFYSFKHFPKNYFRILICFIFIISYSLVLFLFYGTNTYEDYSLNKILYFFSVFLPLIFYSKIKGLDDKFIKSLFLAVTIFFLVGLTKFNSSPDRMAIFGGGPIVFARWIGVFLILSTHFIKNSTLNLILILLSLFLIIKTGSKGPFIFIILTFILSLFYKLKRMKFFILSVLFICVYPILIISLEELIGPRIFSIFTLEFLEATSTVGRLDRWRLAYNVFLENPFGVGLGNYVPYSKFIESNSFILSEYPHNLFLELASELGILGIVIVIYLLFRSYKYITNPNVVFYKKQIMFFTLLNCMISGDLMDSRLLLMFLL